MGEFDLSQVDFEALRQVDVRTVDPDTLVEIPQPDIAPPLPREQRMAEFVRQEKHP